VGSTSQLAERRRIHMSTIHQRTSPQPLNRFAAHAGRAKWATVQIATDFGSFTGRLYIPESKRRVSDVLSDSRPFLSLTEVTASDDGPVEPFIAINKSHVRFLRVLDDGAAELIPAQDTIQ
jgi:hypothetical protein